MAENDTRLLTMDDLPIGSEVSADGKKGEILRHSVNGTQVKVAFMADYRGQWLDLADVTLVAVPDESDEVVVLSVEEQLATLTERFDVLGELVAEHEDHIENQVQYEMDEAELRLEEMMAGPAEKMGEWEVKTLVREITGINQSADEELANHLNDGFQIVDVSQISEGFPTEQVSFIKRIVMLKRLKGVRVDLADTDIPQGEKEVVAEAESVEVSDEQAE